MTTKDALHRLVDELPESSTVAEVRAVIGRGEYTTLEELRRELGW